MNPHEGPLPSTVANCDPLESGTHRLDATDALSASRWNRPDHHRRCPTVHRRRGPRNRVDAASSTPGMTCWHVSAVHECEWCPRRSCTTFVFSPSARRMVAWVCRNVGIGRILGRSLARIGSRMVLVTWSGAKDRRRGGSTRGGLPTPSPSLVVSLDLPQPGQFADDDAGDPDGSESVTCVRASLKCDLPSTTTRTWRMARRLRPRSRSFQRSPRNSLRRMPVVAATSASFTSPIRGRT